jgi:hypothetical protein
MEIKTTRIKPSTRAALATALTQMTVKLFEDPDVEREFQAWKKKRKEKRHEVQSVRILRGES